MQSQLSFPEGAGQGADELLSMHRKALTRAGSRRLEIYRRAARTLRVGLDGSGRRVESSAGRDDGIALRIAIGEGARAAFAAASGSGLSTVEQLVDRLLASPTPVETNDPLELFTAEVSDDEPADLPAASDLLDWLRRSLDSLAGSGVAPSPLESWVEAAAVVESWAAGPAAWARRSRTRCWAMARPPGGGPPLVTASRSWTTLDDSHWTRLAHDRHAVAPDRRAVPAGRYPVLFAAEAAADLVAAVARAIHAPGAAVGSPVGAGWRVTDRPRAAAALYGGLFDDLVAETSDLVLADGRSILAGFDGTGHARRPSFRDHPAPHPSNIVLQAPGVAPPPGIRHVSMMRLHPLRADRWVIEAVRPGGSPFFISASPLGLARACVGGHGESEASHRGVVTPPLLFSDLQVIG